MDRNRTAGSVAAALAIVALAVTAPAARADDLTGTPTPPGTSTSASGAAGTTSTETTTSSTTTGTTTSTTATTTPSTTTSTTTTPSPTTTTPPPPAPSPVVIPEGSSGWKVKDLQVRLRLVKASYWTYAVSGVYGWTLGQRVLTFQTDQGLPTTGVVDQRTWNRLVALTATPTRLKEGASGNAVKDLQVRLRVVKASYWSYAVSGYYGWTLGQRVLAFQRDQNLPQSGVLDQRTWSRLVSLTASPTAISTSAPAANVRELQRRLGAKGLWPYAYSGTYGWTLGQKVLAFQRTYDVPQSGVVDTRTWARLRALTYVPGTFDKHRYYAGLRPLVPTLASLDKRCRTGRVMCVDKATRTLTWVVDGKPQTAMWARFGRPGHETREGTFSVSRKYEYVISNLYFTPMPYSMFFSGGQAVHYSSNFARLGYASASHGCVNIADYAQVKALFFKVRIGDKVVVYH
ncbi:MULTISPECIES: L,D-transpeptidase family protein [unclassified Terrabacter]|uniref:L,D-transpeptidase family protein n=1 Tax=unclassified Terrabacter TaxID=2630222 RepID=UPI0009EAFE3D|nr:MULTISPECIES: L,D-transpeptidase family protein [unclassified Terrabacter]